jgi:hypothetical protein
MKHVVGLFQNTALGHALAELQQQTADWLGHGYQCGLARLALPSRKPMRSR